MNLQIVSCLNLSKYWCEEDGSYEDGAEDHPWLCDWDSLGQGLCGVEGCDEGEGDSGDEDCPADQEQVGRCLASHWIVLISLST